MEFLSLRTLSLNEAFRFPSVMTLFLNRMFCFHQGDYLFRSLTIHIRSDIHGYETNSFLFFLHLLHIYFSKAFNIVYGLFESYVFYFEGKLLGY